MPTKNLPDFWRQIYLSKCGRKGRQSALFVIKNHSFSDGNKRIEAFLFVWFLEKNSILCKKDGSRKIADNALVVVDDRIRTTARIPLLPQALSIIGHYENDPQCILQDSVLPILSNQKMNAYLKEIADLCGINKNLTFHMPGTLLPPHTVTLSNGVCLYRLKLFPKCWDTEI